MLGWLLAAAIAVSVLYGFYPSYHSGVPMTKAGQVVYGSLCRYAWGVAVAWVVFACKYGFGGKEELNLTDIVYLQTFRF